MTGAGGSIGSALAKTIAGFSPRNLVLLDHSECNLYQIETELTAMLHHASLSSIVGDICDERLLADTFKRYHPEIIYHAAAFKHVPLMERNPIAAIQNNAIGTILLAQAVLTHGVERLVMVSTDKAVKPRSIMGASKRVAELALMRFTTVRSQMRAIRLGNVLDTEGSVTKVFAQQIFAGGPVTVTHPDVTRYFLTLPEAIELILLGSELEEDGGILICDLGVPVKILDLARRMIEAAGADSKRRIAITFTGMRPGDKMAEEFIAEHESVEPTSDGRLSKVKSKQISRDQFDSHISDLRSAVDRYDLAALLETLFRIVPEYQPSESLLGLLEGASA